MELKLLQTMGQAGMGRQTAMVQFHNLQHMDLVHAQGRWLALLALFIFRSIFPHHILYLSMALETFISQSFNVMYVGLVQLLFSIGHLYLSGV